MTGAKCEACGVGWHLTYKSRRTRDGTQQVQYAKCWACQHRKKLIVPARPPNRRVSISGTDLAEVISTSNPN